MTHVKTADGTSIYYKDWGQGQPILFSHGWPLNADAWDAQMVFFGQQGYRVIAHDRRSHGRSSQTWDGNNMNTYADDLKTLIDTLDLQNLVLIGHSTGGGEISHYLGRHGTKRVAKAVLIAAVPPLMLKTKDNPEGLPISVFDELRGKTYADRSQFFKELALPFYGFNRKGSHVSQGLIDSFWHQGMTGGIKGLIDCIREFSEVDYTDDLKKMSMPTLIIHGDDDQIVPIQASGQKSAKILKHAVLKVYPGAPHGLAQTLQDQVNADILQFIRS